MSLAVQIARNGGPEEMKLVDVDVGAPGPGEVRIRHHAIGLNFIDVYQRTGLYTLPLPLNLGMEAAGGLSGAERACVDCPRAVPISGRQFRWRRTLRRHLAQWPEAPLAPVAGVRCGEPDTSVQAAAVSQPVLEAH